MKAVQLISHGAPGRYHWGEVPDPAPGPEEVVVKVGACGLNRLDLWLEEGSLPISLELPRIPGSEIAGEIGQVGDAVKGWNEGEKVAIQSNLFCGSCEFCLAGEESRCLRGRLLGVEQDGGFAEKVLAPARALVRLPEGVSELTAAALTLAGSTAMHMLTRRAAVRPGDWVLVVAGASGVGSAAIQIAKELGGYVVATASSEPKRALAASLGAQAVVDSSNPDWPAEVRRLTGKRGADLVVEHVGGKVLEDCLRCLARGGTIVTCGATAGRAVSLDLWPFFVKEQKIAGSYGRTRKDLEVTLEWARLGKLKPVIDQIFPLEKAQEALARLRGRAVLGKVLVSS